MIMGPNGKRVTLHIVKNNIVDERVDIIINPIKKNFFYKRGITA